MVTESLTILQNQTQNNYPKKLHGKGHRPFHLSLYNLLCTLNDAGGCMIYTNLYINCRSNTKELEMILKVSEEKGFVKTVERCSKNKDVIKYIHEKYSNINIFSSRKFVMLTAEGSKFIDEFSDYFEELEYIFENVMPRNRKKL